MSAHSLKIAPASRFIRVWRSDVGHNHWISDGPTPGQRLADTIESIAEPPLTVLSFIDKPMHIHDLNATLLHCPGIDHERLTYRFQGRDYRLTDVHGKVVQDVLA